MPYRTMVTVVTTTGISALVLKKIGARTVHSAFALDDGRHNNEDLATRILKDPQYRDRYNEITNMNCLILDEVSMLSKRMFEQLEYIIRVVRGSEILFGGVQVIFSGDFYQLPPVPNHDYGDYGHFAFQSDIFSQVFRHNILLTDVKRQEDPLFIEAIQESARGSISKTSDDYLLGLSRSLHDKSNPTFLYATKFEVEYHNAKALQRLPGEPTIITSQDEGDEDQLKKMPAPHVNSLNF
ncbi:ATP-dependent DNA helicase PIF1-like [Lingula anatina]|uniref:ATP-dependent DNA helicase n=1 Tax=Lingula anatina TaxID=7574 RepID=A0A1S3IM18_LINAN|nr:ATP-dependent DNA helicase PIF1-like [Lingula anatina]|eukprot:XP_013399285.2 ATP-dependent DNA helicase PIF1-like [Lingula anatina]